MDSLTVVLATDSRDPSGIGHHMLTLGAGLAPDHRVVLAFADAGGGPLFAAKARAAGLDAVAIGDAGFLTFLRERAPDVLHVHAGIGWEGQRLARSGREAGVAVVRTEHLPWLITDPAQEAEYARAAEEVDAFVAVSEAAAAGWRAALGRLRSGARLATIENGVVAPPGVRRTRGSVRRRLGVGEEPLLLCVARFTPQKDHASLIEAYAMLAAGGRKLRLALVGDGVGQAECKARVAALALGGVDFLGLRDDVGALMRAADVLVLPSLFEGLPLVVLESMAVGLPVVATRIGGTVEALGSGHPFYCAAGDPADLARVLRAVLGDGAAARRSAEAARARFEERFTARRMTQDTARLYRSVVRTNVFRGARGLPVEKTRVGFVGCGGIAHRHLGVLAGFDDVEVVAVADQDSGRARAAAERVGARAFAGHEEMLAEMTLDALWICVPPFAHGAPERAALEAGLPFFVEKPVSLDLALAVEIEEAVRRAGLVTAVGYHWRYLDTVDEARRLLRENPPHLMSGYWLDQTPPPDWWRRQDRSGGQMVEQATHVIDLARFLAGDVVEVFGMAARRDREEFPGLDVATASTAALRFASGAIANLSATCVLGWGHRIGLHVFAEGLAIELSDHDIMVDVGRGRPARDAEGDPVWREDRAFVDAVRGGENRIRTPYAEALETHRVALAVARSARTGAPVTMEGLRADPQPPFRPAVAAVPRVA